MALKLSKSKYLFKKAERSLAGGVNSPVRSFSSVGGSGLFVRKARGCHLWDVDDNKYIDYIMSWGVNILGHSHKQVIAAAIHAMERGMSFGLCVENEIKLSEKIKKHVKSIGKLRLVNSGTEACMSAIRLARAFTGRRKVIKFDGCYHGHFDGLLVKAGSGNLTFGVPSSKGIMKAYTKDTLSVPFNNLKVLHDVVSRNRDEIACIIMEPILCNAGVISPQDGFLRQVEKVARREKIVLIFDEIITGFRLALGGAQTMYGISPDLTCLGKIIGGGFPVGAYGGRAEIMDLLAPSGPVYQAGTLSGNPVAVSAGLKTLEILEHDTAGYRELRRKTRMLARLIETAAGQYGIAVRVNQIGSLFSVFYIDREVNNHQDALATDMQMNGRVFNGLLAEGVLFPPSAFEACFVSHAHRLQDIERTAKSFKRVFKRIGPQ